MKRPVRLFPLAAAFACALLALAACGGSAGQRPGSPTPTASPTATRSPTPIATAAVQPRSIPAGWQVYAGPHFAIALPSGWTAQSFTQGDSTAASPDLIYSFDAPDHRGSVQVQEHDDISPSDIQTLYCTGFAQNALVSFAGLPMHYFDTGDAGTARSWVFISNKGTVYGLQANDGFDPPADLTTLNTSVLTTFTAEYTTPGCS